MPQRHQRDDLALVDVQRERMLAGNRSGHHLAALVVGLDLEGGGQRSEMRRTTSAEGTTSSMRQPFELPTSMYSMKRAMWPLERQRSAIGRMSRSLTPRLTTMLIFNGARPAAAAASMPSITFATGKSTSFMARKVASSSESRLTVTRSSPAPARACAFLT